MAYDRTLPLNYYAAYALVSRRNFDLDLFNKLQTNLMGFEY